MDITIIKLGAGLLLLIVANIILGSVGAAISKTWDWTKFWNGVTKGIAITAALVAVYYAGYLNPDLLVIETGGQTVNLMTAIYITLMAAFTVYAVDVVKKLKEMLTSATPGSADTETEGSTELEDPESGEWLPETEGNNQTYDAEGDELPEPVDVVDAEWQDQKE